MPWKVLQTAFAAIATVPSVEVSDPTSTRPTWKMLPSMPVGMPIFMMRFVIVQLKRYGTPFAKWIGWFSFDRITIIATAPKARDTSVGIATPAVPILKPRTSSALLCQFH